MRKIAVLGYGTVGSGVVAVLDKSRKEVARKLGDQVEVQAVLDLRDFPADPVQEKIVHDFQVILDNPEIEVVAEVMGGLHPAFEYTSQALAAGKHVVTSNKELVEAKGAELAEIARAHGVSFLFEASVAGGIPILRTINTALIQEEIYRVTGILNGTTNYILELMENAGASFEEALADAQARGYAERSPEADIEGFDASRKIAILASMISGHHIDYKDVPTRGISSVTIEDIEAALTMNGRIKLIASCQKEEGKLYASVEPMFVPGENMLASVNSVYNAVMLKSSMLTDTLYYGKGAGKLATASAVVADILAALNGNGIYEMNVWSSEKEMPGNPAERLNRYMIRAEGPEVDEVLLEEVISNAKGWIAMTLEITPEQLKAVTDKINQQAKVCSVFRKIEE